MLSTTDVRHHGAKLRYTVLVLAAIILVAGSSARAADPFKIAMLPDTQYYSEIPAYNDIFYNQADYVSDTSKFSFVTHVGDIVQHGNSAAQWAVAENAFGRLDQSGIAYGVACGNHDYDSYSPPSGDATSFTNHFGPQRFANKSWEYGSMSGSGGKSSYHIFDGGGRDFMSLNLSMNSPDADLAWAKSAIDAHPDIPVIVSTHEYLRHDPAGRPTQAFTQSHYGFTNVNSPEQVWQKFIGTNDRIFMVLGGHWHGEYNQTSTNIAGKPVHEILADYQDAPNGGNGYLRELHFKPDEKKIEVHTYSPWLNASETDANSRFDLYFDYDEAISKPPVNIALTGTGILGIAAADDGSYGTDQPRNDGKSGNVNDGNLATRTDTWNVLGSGGGYDWVGVTFAASQSNINEVTISLSTSGTGGWFGPANSDPGSGNALLESHLTAPKVQITTDGGTTWTDVTGVTDDYVSQLTDHVVGEPGAATRTLMATFDFAQTGAIDGIRLFGVGGGTVADETGAEGFLGVFEIGVNQVPEPATMSLLGIGGLLALVRRRRK